MWVYDDGTIPEKPKTNRAGPRWGLVQNDGRVLAVGILYASYLGGNEGYTATACDGRDWFDQLFWLGVNRAPAGWHKWTFDFDPEEGIQILHEDQNGKPTRRPSFDNTKAGLQGFSALAIWGDSGAGKGQTLWVDDVAVTLGGPVKSVPKPPPTAPRVVGPNLWVLQPKRSRFTPRRIRPRHRSSKTCRCRRASRNTASPGRSTSPPASASSSTATGTWSAR